MNKKFIKDAFLWGFVLWFIGYALGILLFAFVPNQILGWVIMPIGVIISLFVLLKKVKGDSFQYYALVALDWVLIAVICDYFFLLKLFRPADGYYKLDVYVYYFLTFAIPLLFGLLKFKGNKNREVKS